MGYESGHGLAGSFWLHVSHEVAVNLSSRAAVPSEGLTGGGPSSTSMRVVVGRMLFLAGCWTEGLSSSLDWLGVSFSSQPHRPPYRAAHSLAAGAPKIEANDSIT